eukprot:TRINITY_DN39565_c0_g1_i1.p1 TRINITY_DN39565_c0_g1~~TRINITY_DN39565_c0_g1_i1.p1  ORF type:complete len:772 (-),score=82.15 TRINITY_DN39565_c0_g1_i1:194-2509(-)
MAPLIRGPNGEFLSPRSLVKAKLREFDERGGWIPPLQDPIVVAELKHVALQRIGSEADELLPEGDEAATQDLLFKTVANLQDVTNPRLGPSALRGRLPPLPAWLSLRSLAELADLACSGSTKSFVALASTCSRMSSACYLARVSEAARCLHRIDRALQFRSHKSFKPAVLELDHEPLDLEAAPDVLDLEGSDLKMLLSHKAPGHPALLATTALFALFLRGYPSHGSLSETGEWIRDRFILEPYNLFPLLARLADDTAPEILKVLQGKLRDGEGNALTPARVISLGREAASDKDMLATCVSAAIIQLAWLKIAGQQVAGARLGSLERCLLLQPRLALKRLERHRAIADMRLKKLRANPLQAELLEAGFVRLQETCQKQALGIALGSVCKLQEQREYPRRHLISPRSREQHRKSSASRAASGSRAGSACASSAQSATSTRPSTPNTTSSSASRTSRRLAKLRILGQSKGPPQAAPEVKRKTEVSLPSFQHGFRMSDFYNLNTFQPMTPIQSSSFTTPSPSTVLPPSDKQPVSSVPAQPPIPASRAAEAPSIVERGGAEKCTLRDALSIPNVEHGSAKAAIDEREDNIGAGATGPGRGRAPSEAHCTARSSAHWSTSVATRPSSAPHADLGRKQMQKAEHGRSGRLLSAGSSRSAVQKIEAMANRDGRSQRASHGTAQLQRSCSAASLRTPQRTCPDSAWQTHAERVPRSAQSDGIESQGLPTEERCLHKQMSTPPPEILRRFARDKQRERSSCRSASRSKLLPWAPSSMRFRV